MFFLAMKKFDLIYLENFVNSVRLVQNWADFGCTSLFVSIRILVKTVFLTWNKIKIIWLNPVLDTTCKNIASLDGDDRFQVWIPALESKTGIPLSKPDSKYPWGQKYSRLRCVKGLVICFYLCWFGSILQIRTNIIKAGSKSWLLNILFTHVKSYYS